MNSIVSILAIIILILTIVILIAIIVSILNINKDIRKSNEIIDNIDKITENLSEEQKKFDKILKDTSIAANIKTFFFAILDFLRIVKKFKNVREK